jgi:hypothetical protein
MVKYRDFLPDDTLFDATYLGRGPYFNVRVRGYLTYKKHNRRNVQFALQFLFATVLVIFILNSFFFFYYTIKELPGEISFYGLDVERYKYDWSSIIVYLSAAIVTGYHCLWLYPRIKWMKEYIDTDKKQYSTKIREIKRRNRAVSKSEQIIGIESYFGYVFGIFFFALKLLGIVAIRAIPPVTLYVFAEEYIRLTT